MEEEPSATRFKHEPLPDSTTYIRLLEIQGIDSDGHVACLLNAWPVASTPDYYALSYTWGSPTPSHQVFINNCVFEAGQNCVDALKQAYSSTASRYFWMDALCIDQSTIQEKSHQVEMMGQIYAKSKHMFACVGPHTNDSMSLFNFIGENWSLLDNIHELTLECTLENAFSWVTPNLIPTSYRSYELAIECLKTKTIALEVEALSTMFIAFMNRPYFSRVWVLQELHLAPEITLCCGMERRPVDRLLAMSMMVDYLVNTDYHVDRLKLQKSWGSIKPQRGCLDLASGFRGRRRLTEILEAMQSFHCSDVRDRLFGTLALIEWGSVKPVVPDYGKDNYQVAIEVLRLYLQNPETQPVSGLAIEWPRHLWQTFQVHIDGQAVQQTISKGYGSQTMRLDKLSFMYDALIALEYFGRFSPSLGYHVTPSYIPPSDYGVPTWHQDYSGHPKETWCGVQLRDIRHARKETPIPGDLLLRYLYCSAHKPTRGSNSGAPCVEILDHMKRVFGFAPVETRPSDWLLFSKDGFHSDGSPVMVVVKSIHVDRPDYAMVGPASRNCEHKLVVIPYLRWRSFGVNWNAEDLFRFGYMYKNRPIYSDTAKETPASLS